MARKKPLEIYTREEVEALKVICENTMFDTIIAKNLYNLNNRQIIVITNLMARILKTI